MKKSVVSSQWSVARRFLFMGLIIAMFVLAGAMLGSLTVERCETDVVRPFSSDLARVVAEHKLNGWKLDKLVKDEDGQLVLTFKRNCERVSLLKSIVK